MMWAEGHWRVETRQRQWWLQPHLTGAKSLAWFAGARVTMKKHQAITCYSRADWSNLWVLVKKKGQIAAGNSQESTKETKSMKLNIQLYYFRGFVLKFEHLLVVTFIHLFILQFLKKKRIFRFKVSFKLVFYGFYNFGFVSWTLFNSLLCRWTCSANISVNTDKCALSQ